MEILHVSGQPFSDTTIEAYQYHTYQPYTSNLNYNDEIRINIQDLDAYTLPCNSYIYIEGKMLTDDNKVPTKFQFINNGISYLFRELRYELNGVTIDSVRNIGLISTLKNYLSLNENQSKLLQNAGWFPKEDKLKIDTHGNFNVCIPLKIWSGFFEDFQKIIINMRQELVLIREKDDIDAIIATDETETPKIEINKLYWNVPHILPNISEQLRLNKIVRSNTELPIKFRLNSLEDKLADMMDAIKALAIHQATRVSEPAVPRPQQPRWRPALVRFAGSEYEIPEEFHVTALEYLISIGIEEA
ncbi:uncharacterized protein LOC126890974 [Diabrotica virgifera virgifera]|uniref:Double jelly roll-like domain-containing protein n=1 Tax=Diabrotica virgifera virgifera TaxID=50390 RepID=A0ABM5L0Z5_DIAVI|nr:uncharacterized protein LOC126890974 [Diabrotica virgifera virgifera]